MTEVHLLFERYAASLKRWRDAYLQNRTDADLDELEQFFRFTLQEINWTQLATRAQIEDDIWAAIRSNDVVTQFVLNGTTALIAVACHNNAEWTRVLESIAAGMSWVTRSKLTDDILRERAAQRDFLMTSLSSDPWLVFLYLSSINPELMT